MNLFYIKSLTKYNKNLKKYKPITSSLRHRIIINKQQLLKIKTKPIKKLTFGLINKAGKNNSGKITCYHRGGGNKKKYRIIDFKRLLEIFAIVKRIEYDPNRSSFIALICYWTGILSYILAPRNLIVGDLIRTLRGKDYKNKLSFFQYLNRDEINVIREYNFRLKIGDSLPLKNMPIGTLLHNIEIKLLKGGQLLRAAGTYSQLLKIYPNYVYIRLKSGEFRYISGNCIASVGYVSNQSNRFTKDGKAGVSRWLNKRPRVRGVAMNPVDHPHGGRTRGGKPFVHFKGFLMKGQRTGVKNKLISKLIIKTKRL